MTQTTRTDTRRPLQQTTSARFDRNPAPDLAPANGSCHGPASDGPDQPM